jgi:hypothetical protein
MWMPVVRGVPVLIEAPTEVERLAGTLARRHAIGAYERPFRIASILRAYGVRVLSHMGPYAEEALRELAGHADARVRTAVVEELARHRDVPAIEIVSRLALNDRDADVRQAATEALSALQQVAQVLAEEERVRREKELLAKAPLIETGEDAEFYRPPEGPDRDAPSPLDSSLSGGSEPSGSS